MFVFVGFVRLRLLKQKTGNKQHKNKTQRRTRSRAARAAAAPPVVPVGAPCWPWRARGVVEMQTLNTTAVPAGAAPEAHALRGGLGGGGARRHPRGKVRAGRGRGGARGTGC